QGTERRRPGRRRPLVDQIPGSRRTGAPQSGGGPGDPQGRRQAQAQAAPPQQSAKGSTGLIPTDAYIGLGSNLDNPEQQLRTAVAELDTLTGTRLAAVSSWYRSAPLGPAGQPDYINAVARVVTSLPPLALLRERPAVEDRHGRVPPPRQGPP